MKDRLITALLGFVFVAGILGLLVLAALDNPPCHIC